MVLVMLLMPMHRTSLDVDMLRFGAPPLMQEGIYLELVSCCVSLSLPLLMLGGLMAIA